MAQVIPSIPDIDLAGLVDRNQGSADPLARTYEDHSRHMVVVASSIERAAEQVATRAIINVTPPADHAAVARDALRFRHTMASPMLTDMSIHHFDAVPYAHQQDSVWVHALQIDPPWSWFRGAAMVQACLQMSADAVGSHVDSWVGMGRGTSWNGDWEINAADGSSPWDGDSAPRIVGGPPCAELHAAMEPGVRVASRRAAVRACHRDRSGSSVSWR